jgi:hypothetical protein
MSTVNQIVFGMLFSEFMPWRIMDGRRDNSR